MFYVPNRMILTLNHNTNINDPTTCCMNMLLSFDLQLLQCSYIKPMHQTNASNRMIIIFNSNTNNNGIYVVSGRNGLKLFDNVWVT